MRRSGLCRPPREACATAPQSGERAPIGRAPADNQCCAPNNRNAYEGRALAMVRSGAEAGKVTVRVSAPGLVVGEVVLTVK